MKSSSAYALFTLCLMAAITATISTETDITCLKSIKASLQDPFNHFKTWDFTNNTEGFICNFIGVACWHDNESKVLNLQLSDMGLKGNFPVGIQNCTSLTGLDLSNNQLQGPIPFGIAKMLPFITTLDLSFNNFSGDIPSSLAHCSYLNVLKLDHNRLTGRIPPELASLNRITQFSVDNNLLSGPEPKFRSNNTPIDAGPCATCSSEPIKWQNWRFDYSFKGGFEIGYVVFAVSTMVLYASYCVPWVYIRNRNQIITIPAMVQHMLKNREEKFAEFDQFATLSTLDFLLEKEVTKSESFVTRMGFEDLRQATENFSEDNIIGFGGTGTLYKAALANGWSLAVKKFFNSQNSEEQFITELKILGRLRHNNINPLIGFCKESRKRLLVYNYASNGKLSDWLHSMDGEKKNVLTCPIRMKIAVGLARGLAWLHQCCDFRVAHLSVSSRSVLLDMNFEPKLSNFGMASLINPNEIRRGFVMDMEFWEQCFVKEDVFNFGVVLLELVTGKKAAILKTSFGSYGDEDDAINELVKEEGCNHEMVECIRIAHKCMQPFPEQRPTMLDVYTRISIIEDRSSHIV